MKVSLYIRRRKREFKSIEKVFRVLNEYIKGDLIELPNESTGLIPRIKNIFFFLGSSRKSIKHITGHDHYLLFFKKSKKTILTIHDIEALKRKQGIKRILFQKIWFDRPINNSSLVTVISEKTKNELLTIRKYKTPIKVVHNPLTINIGYKKKIGFNENKPTILQIGTKINKNLSTLIESVSELDCSLLIVGKLDESSIKELNSKNIEYANYIDLSEEKLVSIYLSADILAFISTYEGFGLPIIEAQALGVPVLTSNLSSMPEIAGKGALFVNPNSVEEVRKGLLKLIHSKTLRENLINRGYENIERFKPERIADQYMNLYHSLNED